MVRSPLHFHGRIPVPEVAPLTYRDGVTHLELVYELSQYLKNVLHPSLQSTVDQVVADAEQLLSDATAQYVDGVQEFQRIHDAFMSDVQASLRALNDTVVADLVADDASYLSKTLRELFLENEVADETVADYLRDENSASRTVVDTLLDGLDIGDELRTEIDERFTGVVKDLDDTLETYRDSVDTVLSMYPEHYGARGDGDGDDGVALQQWADDGNTNLKPNSVYRTTTPLVYERDHVVLIGNGATIHGVDVDGFLIEARGDHTMIENVHLNGVGGTSRGGMNLQGNFCVVKNTVVEDFYSEPMGAHGIRLSSTHGGHHISGNTVRNIAGINTGELGNRGISRGIYLNTLQSEIDLTRHSLITDNVVDGIRGLEGDGIQILLDQDKNKDGPRYKARVTISNNLVDNCSRRSIKVQGSNVTVLNNVLRDSLGEPKMFRYAMIDIILAARVNVSGNDIDVGGHTGAIYYHGLYSRGSNIVVSNNVVRGKSNSREILIRIDGVLYSSVDHNIVIGGRRGIQLRDSTASSISHNTVHSIASQQSQSNPAGLVADFSCSSIYMAGNVDMTWSAGHNAFVNQSANGVSANNVAVGR